MSDKAQRKLMAITSQESRAEDQAALAARAGRLVDHVTSPALAAVLDRSGCGLALLDAASTRFVDCSDAMRQLLRAESVEEVVGRSPADFAPQQQPCGKDSIAFAAERFRASDDGASAAFEWAVSRSDGSVLVAEVGVVSTAEQGRLLLTAWTPRAWEVATLSASDRFHRLAEGLSPESFYFASDTERQFTYVSDSVRAVLGYTPNELLGRDWHEIVPDNASQSLADKAQQVVFGGVEPPPILFEAAHADGSSRLVEVTPRPLRGPSGEVVGMGGVCKDVSERKQIEAKLLRATEELDARVRERTEELRQRVDFEDLLISLSTGFINLPVDQIDEGMLEALRRIGEFTGVDRCYIYKIDGQGGEAGLTHEWTAPQVPSIKAQMQGINTGDYEWEMQRLVIDRALHVPDVDAMPPEAAALQRLYRRLGVRSAVSIPMLSGGRLIGLLGFVSTRESKLWQEEDIGLAQVLAEVLVNALDRYRAERAVRDSETRYRAIVEDQLDLIVRWLPDGSQTFVNEAVCRMLGRPAEQVLGTSVFDGVHPDDVGAVRQKIVAFTPEQPFAVDEHRILNAEGSVVWMQWVDRALFDSSGELVEYQSIGRDITELRRTQDNLRSRLEFERLVLDISTRFINLTPGGLDEAVSAALAEVGSHTRADRSYVYLVEDPEKEVERSHVQLAYCWQADDARLESPTKRLFLGDFSWAAVKLAGNEPVHVPTLDCLSDLAPRWKERLNEVGIRSYLEVPMTVDGRLLGYLGFATSNASKHWSDDDITLLRLVGEVLRNALERDRAEQALRSSEERLRLVVETVEEGLFDLDLRKKVLFVSDHTMRTYGIEDGRNHRDPEIWRSLIHPDDRPRVELALDNHLNGLTASYEVEYRLKNRDGSYGWRQARGKVVERSDEGEPLRMLGVDRDVTEQVHQEGKTRDLETQLAHLGRVATMGETVAGIAHEVNQPLHAAATFCAAARRGLASGRPDAIAKGSELIQKVGEQVNRAGDIIRSLREFTRPQPVAMRPLDLNAIVREAAALMSYIPNRTSVRVEFELEEPLPPIDGDTIQLQQVVVNLLRNAYESLEPQSSTSCESVPTITVATRGAEALVELSVSDNGPACTLDTPSVVFDPFFTTKPGGMGIGLALCRTIAEAHAGNITAEKNGGGGLRFTLSLPASLKPPYREPDEARHGQR